MKPFGNKFIYLLSIPLFLFYSAIGTIGQFLPLTSEQLAASQNPHLLKGDSTPRKADLEKEYVDILYLGITKNCYIDIKGTLLLSADVGGDKRNVMIAVQENSNIIKLKALKKNFPEANMIIVTQDTVLQYLIRYSDVPLKSYYAYDIKTLKEKVEAAMPAIRANSGREGSTVPSSSLTKSVDSTSLPKDLSQLRGETIKTGALNSSDIKKVSNDTSARLTNDNEQGGEQVLAREEINFERLREKKVNILIGDINAGLEAELNRFYANAQKTDFYYAISLNNRETTDYLIERIEFVIQNKGTYQGRNINLKFQPGSRNTKMIPSGGNGFLVFGTGKIEMMPEEALVITIQLSERMVGVKKVLQIKLYPADMSRAKKWN